MSAEDLELITQRQLEMQARFNSVPDEGIEIEYMGKKFKVYRTVFWPFFDSYPLVENFRINPGESVFDCCTGSGVIAINAAYKGAAKVVAVDINPNSLKAARENTSSHGFSNIIEVRYSDCFSGIKPGETFDVITINPPFRNKKASNLVEATQWDTDLSLHRRFFSEISRHLNPYGRAYMSQSNFGAIHEALQLASDNGLMYRLVGTYKIPDDPREFYAFEFKKLNP